MKEFIEKLIGRLKDNHRAIVTNDEDLEWNRAVYSCTEIVNQLAEEYKHCALCYLQNPCEYQNENIELPLSEWADSNGWIPCSERLPEVEADVLLSLRSLDVYTGFRANTEGCFYVEGEGYVEFENVLSWQPLPEPYKEETT